MDRFVAGFCEVTGSTPEIARNYHTVQPNICVLTLGTSLCVTLILQVSDGSVERAIALFLETGGAELVSHEHPPTAAVASTGNPQRSQSPPPPVPAQSGVLVDHFRYEDEDRDSHDLSSDRGSIYNDAYSPNDALARIDRSHHFMESEYNPSDRQRGNSFIGTTSSRDISNLMFPPPVDLIYYAPFDMALRKAKKEGKLILINVFDPTSFPCQTLNRDLWCNSTVKEFIKENFLFLYMSMNSQEGRAHLNFYPISNFPYIAIIETLTGERVKIWGHQVSVNDFVAEAMEVIEKASRVDPISSPDMFTGQSDGLRTDDDEFSENETEDDVVELDAFDSIKALDYKEPTNGDLTRVQIILPDGSRIIRRMQRYEKVRSIYALLKTTIDRRFEIRSFRDNLIDKLELTLEQAQLLNGTMNVDYE